MRTRPRNAAAATIAAFLLALPAPAQPPADAGSADAPAPRDASALLRPIIERHKVPGLCAAVVELTPTGEPRITALGAAGLRKRSSPEPVTTADTFHLGSCTKAMTATMIATLVQEGTLKWSTTVGEIFGDLGGKMDPQWRTVTLEQLLTHRAGAPADLDAGGLWARLWQRRGTPTEQRTQLVEGVVTRPPAHTPGTKFLYSNAGFAIAGAMAEKATGKAWEDLMRERLFAPLKMDSAGFGAPGTPGTIDQPRGHHENGDPVEPGPGADNPPAIGPGGTVHCTLQDWAKFIALHLRAGRAPSGPGVLALTRENFDKLHTPGAGDPDHQYAMGWGITTRPWASGAAPQGKGLVWTHNGTNTMWYCVVWAAPERGFAVLVACNQGGDAPARACDEAAAALIRDRPAPAPK